MTRNTKHKPVKPEEARQIVLDAYEHFRKYMEKRLKKIPEDQRWLIWARAVSFTFNRHYQMTVNCEQAIVDKKMSNT